MSKPLDPLTPSEIAAASGPPTTASPTGPPSSSPVPLGGDPQAQPAPGQDMPNVDHSYYSPPGSELSRQFSPASGPQAGYPDQSSSQGYTQQPVPNPPPEPAGPVTYDSPMDFQMAQQSTSRPDWMDDNLVEYAKTFNLGEADVARFGDRETAMANLDNWSRMYTPQQQAPPQPNAYYNQPPEFAPTGDQQETPPENEPIAGFTPEGLADMEYWKEIYSEESAPEILGLVQHVSQQAEANNKLQQDVEALAGYLNYTAQQQQEEHINSIFDQMDEELFGRRFDEQGRFKNLEPSAQQNRVRVMEAMVPVMQTMEQQGIDVRTSPMTAIIQRAMPIGIGDVLQQRQMQQRQQALATHSQQRRPVGHSAGQVMQQGAGPTQQQQLSVGDIANMPDIRSWWENTQQTNGNLA